VADLKFKTLSAIGAALCAGLVLAVPGASGAATGAHAGPAAVPQAVGRATRVIIMLRDQQQGLAPRTVARSNSLNSEQTPFVASLRASGARIEKVGHAIPYVVASVTANQRAALARNPLVRGIFPDVVIPRPTPEVATAAAPVARSTASTSRSGAVSARRAATAPSICGTAANPESDPEALSVIHASEANALGYDGAGVTVAYIAGSIDPTIPDFQRNAKWASSGSAAGSPVVTAVNMAGDPAGTPGGDVAEESFLDASSIAAQGNTVYDLNNFISSAHSLPSPCDITVTGAAPGAKVIGIDVFSNVYDTTESNFIQAIDYAVGAGVKVLNESFGANNFPDTALDATRIADDDATAAGVTVVASTGDAGVGNTVGSPATDTNVISAGASTTFRSYEQNFYGGVNATVPNAGNGTWLDNNISSISSSGFSMSGGNTVDVVAPGDLNWIDCSTSPQFADPAAGICADENGNPAPIAQSGGTSESAPLTSAAAADVIQAYASTHHGSDPSPALVKQILMSTATDVAAPAEEQGAGLLNVLAAVKEAISLPGSTATAEGGLLVSPNQVNIEQAPNTGTTQTIKVTNTGASAVTVHLSTRALTHKLATATGSFCLNPSSSSSGACGPPTANTFQIWSGVTEVYQEETFTVPNTSSPSRLEFSADYPDTGQSSLLHVGLFDPSGAYAGYSIPQGLGDYGHIEVADPAPGTWTAVFFTEQDGATGAGSTGTSGTIQWAATTWEFGNGGPITPSTLNIGPGKTATATFTGNSPATPGDTAQSIVLSTAGGATNTIPVTIRTTVPVTRAGGTFTGLLTGGNGRGGAPAATSMYAFSVPRGMRDLDVSAAFNDPGDVLVAYLVDPEGNAVASSSNASLNPDGSFNFTGTVNLYKTAPQAGQWLLTFDWLNPVSGSELSEPFQGAIRFNQVSVSSQLPGKGAVLTGGQASVYYVHIKNTGLSPEAFFLDPRTTTNQTVQLPDLNGSDQNMSLPLAPGLSFPFYLVPPDTTGIKASITGSAPVSFDTEPFPGDPDISPALPAPSVKTSQSGDSASLTYTTSDEMTPGLWLLNPSETGPYGAAGAPSVTASASFSVVTKGFDPTVSTSTGDLWTLGSFSPVWVDPGQSASIPVTITPDAAPGSHVKGVIEVDDTFLVDFATGFEVSNGDQLASLPFSYTVAQASHHRS